MDDWFDTNTPYNLAANRPIAFRNSAEFSEWLQRRFVPMNDAIVMLRVFLDDLAQLETRPCPRVEELDAANKSLEAQRIAKINQQRRELSKLKKMFTAALDSTPRAVTLLYLSPEFESFLRWECAFPRQSCQACLELDWLLECTCSHRYCKDCIHQYFESAMANPNDPFPPRCCDKVLPLGLLNHFATRAFIDTAARKAVERGTKSPVFCRQCTRFISSVTELPADSKNVHCKQCSADTCSQCRELAHEGACVMDTLLLKTQELAERSGWMKCPDCPYIVERDYGCNHMRCPCGTDYCYACGLCYDGRTQMCKCPVFPLEVIEAERAAEQAANDRREDEIEQNRREEAEALRRARDENMVLAEEWDLFLTPIGPEHAYMQWATILSVIYDSRRRDVVQHDISIVREALTLEAYDASPVGREDSACETCGNIEWVFRARCTEPGCPWTACNTCQDFAAGSRHVRNHHDDLPEDSDSYPLQDLVYLIARDLALVKLSDEEDELLPRFLENEALDSNRVPRYHRQCGRTGKSHIWETAAALHCCQQCGGRRRVKMVCLVCAFETCAVCDFEQTVPEEVQSVLKEVSELDD